MGKCDMGSETAKTSAVDVSVPKGMRQYNDLIDNLLSQGIREGAVVEPAQVENPTPNSREKGLKWAYPTAPWIEKVLRMTPFLTFEEERAVIRYYRNSNDESCRDDILYAFLKLSYADAAKFRNPLSPIESTVSFDDLFQEAAIGLMDALEHFQLHRGTRFGTYARYWTRQKTLFVLSQDHCVRIPNNRLELEAKVREMVDAHYSKLGEFPTVKQISKKIRANFKVTCYTLEKVKGEIFDECFPPQPVSQAFIAGHLAALELPTVTLTCGEDLADIVLTASQKRERVHELLEHLNKRESTVVGMYFGFDGPERTLGEIGIRLNLSRERIRQIRNQAIEKLRRIIDPSAFRVTYSELTRVLAN